MSGIEVQHDGLEWVKETYSPKNAGVTVYNNTINKEHGLEDNLIIKFELKPVFVIYNIRLGSPAEQAGLRKKDKILTINGKAAHDLSIEKINELLKSEEGKIITIEVEREKKIYQYKFQLKNII
jgi:C-terminal processing protease CtpA/Prc